MKLDIHRAFRLGAEKLVREGNQYTSLHKGHGIDESSWKLLTQDEYWSPDQARQIRSILASVVEVAMTISGMPAIPLPGQYVAAVIAIIVGPANRLLACTKAPDTFDADAASGIMQTHEVKDMSVQQLMALVIAYSGGFAKEPKAHVLPEDVRQRIKTANTGGKK